jgi:hypothetical protein
MEREKKSVTFGQTIVALLFATLVFAIVMSIYIYLVKKDYDVTIELPCDPAVATCFARDCSVEECPPNELENYKQYTLKGYDFVSCEADTCEAACTSGAVACEEIKCDTEAGDSCSM